MQEKKTRKANLEKIVIKFMNYLCAFITPAIIVMIYMTSLDYVKCLYINHYAASLELTYYYTVICYVYV